MARQTPRQVWADALFRGARARLRNSSRGTELDGLLFRIWSRAIARTLRITEGSGSDCVVRAWHALPRREQEAALAGSDRSYDRFRDVIAESVARVTPRTTSDAGPTA